MGVEFNPVNGAPTRAPVLSILTDESSPPGQADPRVVQRHDFVPATVTFANKRKNESQTVSTER
jgi:hypothetical protein